ncbi:MAG: SDR family NAD(P)-dependent oxidoreductase [Nocardioides sp.]|uniref:SDR family NAD(P)-dependent oxidoreductase n=1 Tax=Nocardioides sp. TaxID=35761 RepID=UPI003F10CC0B
MATTHTTVVIGAASGIGAATADLLESSGHTLVRADLNASEGVLAVNVADEESVAGLFDEVVAKHGGFTGVVNCAGVSSFGHVVDHDTAEFRRVVDVNLVGAYLVLKHAGQGVDDGGSLVTLSSLNARQPGPAMAAYCSSKAGVAMLSQVAAMELAARRVRVNTVAPGLIVTPLTEPAMGIPGVRDDYLENTPLGRSGEPAEIGGAVRYLLSDDAAWVTGETIDINGGAHLMRYPDLHKHVTAAFG